MSHALIAFVNARLDEDEAAALASRNAPTDALRYVDADEWSQELLYVADEDRVLREVEAKRRLITFAFENAASIDGEWGDCHEAAEIAAGQCKNHGAKAAAQVLRLLAAVYSDHPDYRQEWAP